MDWLVSAGAGFGGKYDSNVNATAINPQKVYGANFQPILLAEHNTGIQNTQLYLNGDVSYYPSIGKTYLDGTRAGIIHVWEIQRDLIWRFQAQVAEVQAGSSFNNFLTSGIYATTPVNYTQIFGSSSIQKEFGSFFTAVGGSITGTKYQNSTDNLGNTIDEQFQNGTVSTVNTRLGYRISAFFYTYVEPSYNWTQYNGSRPRFARISRSWRHRVRPDQPVQRRGLRRLSQANVRGSDGWSGDQPGCGRQAFLVPDTVSYVYRQRR